MAKTFRLTVASVTEPVFDGEALSVTVPGTGGTMTILANHEPLVSTLRAGDVTIREEGGEKKIPVEGGIVECSGARVVVLL